MTYVVVYNRLVNTVKLESKAEGIPLELVFPCGPCYVPTPQRLIVHSDSVSHQITATDCASSRTVWCLEGTVEEHTIDPWCIVYLPSHGAVLVVDRENSRVLVLDPASRHALHTVRLPDMDWVWGLCLHYHAPSQQYRLYILNQEHDTHMHTISYFCIN